MVEKTVTLNHTLLWINQDLPHTFSPISYIFYLVIWAYWHTHFGSKDPLEFSWEFLKSKEGHRGVSTETVLTAWLSCTSCKRVRNEPQELPTGTDHWPVLSNKGRWQWEFRGEKLHEGKSFLRLSDLSSSKRTSNLSKSYRQAEIVKETPKACWKVYVKCLRKHTDW